MIGGEREEVVGTGAWYYRELKEEEREGRVLEVVYGRRWWRERRWNRVSDCRAILKENRTSFDYGIWLDALVIAYRAG